MTKILALVALGVFLFLFIRALEGDEDMQASTFLSRSSFDSTDLSTSAINSDVKDLFKDE